MYGKTLVNYSKEGESIHALVVELLLRFLSYATVAIVSIKNMACPVAAWH